MVLKSLEKWEEAGVARSKKFGILYKETVCADSQEKIQKVNSYWEFISYYAIGATAEDMASFLGQPKKSN